MNKKTGTQRVHATLTRLREMTIRAMAANPDTVTGQAALIELAQTLSPQLVFHLVDIALTTLTDPKTAELLETIYKVADGETSGDAGN